MLYIGLLTLEKEFFLLIIYSCRIDIYRPKSASGNLHWMHVDRPNLGAEEEEKVNKTLQKKNVKDHEYKVEEQRYYSVAHTAHEVVMEQATIMVHG